jgi:hypothetical protein
MRTLVLVRTSKESSDSNQRIAWCGDSRSGLELGRHDILTCAVVLGAV